MRARLRPAAPLIRFGLLALLPVVALGAVLARELNADVQQRYLDSARSSATLISQVGIQPLLSSRQLTDGLTASDIALIDEKLQGASSSQQVTRLKVWNTKGTIVYSDNHALIGRTFKIDTDLGEALDGKPSANITDGHDEENSGDNLAGPLVQVYVPLILNGGTSPSGAFELYLPYAPVQAAIDRESQQLYGLLAGGLALFYLSMFPVVLLADRWRRRAETAAMANLAVLERLNTMKSEFLIRISHQFRTALVGIEGFSEVIRDSERLDLEEVKEFANDIHSDAERLDRAFNEMLELDEMEAGRAKLHLETIDLNQLVREAVEAKGNASSNVVLTLDPSLHRVSCDRAKVSHALTNLVSNAVKYTRPETDVEVLTEGEGDHVKVTVIDHGPGMTPGFDKRTFVSSANGGGGGTGLDLPIARQIVEMHGGRMWFESAAGQGTAFHFTLPLKARITREMKKVEAS